MEKIKPDRIIKIYKEKFKKDKKKEIRSFLVLGIIASFIPLLTISKADVSFGAFFLLELIFVGLLLYLKVVVDQLFYKPYDDELDERDGVTLSKDGELGRNKMIMPDSFEESLAFNKADRDKITDIKGIIIGTKNGQFYQKKRERNGNAVIYGIPGSGKTVCLNFPIIQQSVLNGDSVIVTDPKLETYNITASLAKAYGYDVKILICDPDFTKYTDCCDLMKPLREVAKSGGAVIDCCNEFVNAIMDNSDGGAHQSNVEFWYKMEQSLLNAMVRTLAVSKVYKCTLEQLYELNSKPLGEFIAIMNAEIGSMPNHPAKRPWQTFSGFIQSPQIINSIYSGLDTRLSFLDSPIARKMLSTDEISLTEIGNRPSIYYIGASINHRSLDVVMSLFFTMLFQSLSGYALSLESQRLPVKVIALLDEFKNIGKIPNMAGTLATVRSQNIDIFMILQGLDQLEQMYPNGESHSITNPCEMQILLSTNDTMTAEYFSEMSGEMTLVTQSARTTKSISNPLDVHASYQSQSQLTQSAVMTVGDVRTMGCDTFERQMLLVSASHNPIKLNTFYYKDHPLYQIMQNVNFQNHHPKWWDDLIEDDAAMFGISKAMLEKKEEWPSITPLTEEELNNYDPKKYQKLWERWCAENSHNKDIKLNMPQDKIKTKIRFSKDVSYFANYESGL